MELTTLQFIKKFIYDGLSIQLNYFVAPFDDITAFDGGLRRGFLQGKVLYDELLGFFNKTQNNYYYVLSDKYLLHYIVFRPFEDKMDLLTLGPFTSQPIDETFFHTIATINQLDFNAVTSLKGSMYQYPLYDNNFRLITVLNDLLEFINPSAKTFSIQYVDLMNTPQTSATYVPREDYEMYVGAIQRQYDTETQMLDFVAAGNHIGALKAAKQFIQVPFGQRLSDVLHEKKALLFSSNTLLRKAAQRSGVHPIYLHELSSQKAIGIEKLANSTDAVMYYEGMIRDYCKLVRNKSRIQYAPLIREALNYIDTNISGQLSLSHISEVLHVTAPYLSGMFKKEVGITLTEYMNQQRIHISLKMLNTTNMRIQDIAAYVGIGDLNYFTRIFKKEIGCTPRDYRKKLQE